MQCGDLVRSYRSRAVPCGHIDLVRSRAVISISCGTSFCYFNKQNDLFLCWYSLSLLVDGSDASTAPAEQNTAKHRVCGVAFFHCGSVLQCVAVCIWCCFLSSAQGS